MCSPFCNAPGKAQTPGWVARGRRPRQKKQRALRWVWGEAGHHRGAVTRPSPKERAPVGKQGRQCWLPRRYFPSSAPRARHALLRANVPWCVDEGWGLAYWARALCAFQAGIYFDLVLRVLIRPGSAGPFAGEGSGDTWHPAVVVRWPSGPPVSVWPSPVAHRFPG